MKKLDFIQLILSLKHFFSSIFRTFEGDNWKLNPDMKEMSWTILSYLTLDETLNWSSVDHWLNMKKIKLCATVIEDPLWNKQTLRTSDHVAFFVIPAELLNPFQTRVHLLQLFPLLSSLFIRSFPGGQFKCHRWDCEMRFVFGSLSLPQDGAVITQRVEK